MATVEHEQPQKTPSQIPPGSFRQSVVLTAKRMKSSWVELGKMLVKVRDEALFEQWGYPAFETYCLAELRIRKATAMKLTRNFSFLDRHEPERVAEPEFAQTAPAFEVVEVLAQAEERGQLSNQEYKSVRDAIWNQEKPTSELRRELTEKFPAPEPRVNQAAEVKRLWTMAKRLHAELAANKKLPRELAERAEALAGDLEALAAEKAEA
jgi:hypothetical protein